MARIVPAVVNDTWLDFPSEKDVNRARPRASIGDRRGLTPSVDDALSVFSREMRAPGSDADVGPCRTEALRSGEPSRP